MTTPPTNLRQFPARAGAKVGIAIDLDHLRRLMREFIDEHADSHSSQIRLEWTFETFLQWLRKRMETTSEG
jgi:hypothetical protein